MGSTRRKRRNAARRRHEQAERHRDKLQADGPGPVRPTRRETPSGFSTAPADAGRRPARAADMLWRTVTAPLRATLAVLSLLSRGRGRSRT